MSAENDANDRNGAADGVVPSDRGGLELDAFRGRTWLERAVLPFLREQMLWPVLVAILVHVIALIAPLLVLALRDRHGWSMFGVSVFVVVSLGLVGFDFRERRRLGVVAIFFGLVWLLCGAGAFVVMYFGIV